MTNDIKLTLRIAGNTYDPAMLILRDKGYRLWPEIHDDESLSWSGEKDGRLFSATNPAELLGLVAIWEARGDDWRAKVHEDRICDALLGGLS